MHPTVRAGKRELKAYTANCAAALILRDGIYMQYFLIILVTLAGSVIQRVTGFGFGIFAMMFLPYFFEIYGEANALTGLLSAFSTIIVTLSLFRHVHWKNIIFPVAGSMLMTFLAVTFMKGQNDSLLKIMLGVALILMSLYFILFSDKIHIRPTWYGGLIAGCLSGILNGLFAMGGPPVVVYFMESEKEPKRYLATIQAFFALTNIYSSAVKAAAGYVSMTVLLCFAVGCAGMLAGLLIGRLIFSRLNAAKIKNAVYGMMAVSGAVNIIAAVI